MNMVVVQLPESLVKRLEEEGVPVNEAGEGRECIIAKEAKARSKQKSARC
jgi:hypothetical protein